MAISRPWATPEDVKAYTEYPSVKARDNSKLTVDISRAEQYIISFTNNKFDSDELTTVPDSLRTATILVAEAYAYNACLSSNEMKSESFDDYSYTMADVKPIDISALDIASLLEEFTVSEARRGVTLRMRAL